MEPYRVPPRGASPADEPSSLDYARFARIEQLTIYLLMAIAVIAIALAEIKIP